MVNRIMEDRIMEEGCAVFNPWSDHPSFIIHSEMIPSSIFHHRFPPMLKLLLCILSTAVVAVIVLQLRQQHVNLNYQVNRLHNQLESKQPELWQQQIQIAIYTAPNAIARTVGEHSLTLVAPKPVIPERNAGLPVRP